MVQLVLLVPLVLLDLAVCLVCLVFPELRVIVVSLV